MNTDDSNVCLYKEDNSNEIIPNLWLGDNNVSYDVNFIKKNKIKHIIRVMPEFDKNKIFNGINYYYIPIKDSELCYKYLNNLFDQSSLYIKNALIKKEAVLIHCKRGHHRSATILAAFLIKYLKMDLYETILYINSIRPCALRRNTCIIKALNSYYLSLNS